MAPEIAARLTSGERFNCPCCDQKVFLRPHHLTDKMANQLLMLYRAFRPMNNNQLRPHVGGGWIQYSLLRHWGLATVDNHLWSITELGRQFVRGETSMPRTALLYNNVCYGFSDADRIMIDDLGVSRVSHRPRVQPVASPPARRRPT